MANPRLNQADKSSFSTAKTTLESKNYTVNTLNLLSTNSIPEDALAIIIGGPNETPRRAQRWLCSRNMWMQAVRWSSWKTPLPLQNSATSPDPLAEYLTSDWGITLNNDIVIDLVNTQNPLQAVSSQIGTAPDHTEPDPKLHRDPSTSTKPEHCRPGGKCDPDPDHFDNRTVMG